MSGYSTYGLGGGADLWAPGDFYAKPKPKKKRVCVECGSEINSQSFKRCRICADLRRQAQRQEATKRVAARRRKERAQRKAQQAS